ncbi:MAG: glycosyltransferase family 4 protein [Ramlibacter sp.]
MDKLESAAGAQPPRLAIVRSAYNATGGAERFVQRIAGALALRGVDVTLIARRWPHPAGTGLPAGVRLIELKCFHVGRTWRDASFARAVRTAVEREAFDLVQSHERIPGLALYRAGDGVHREWLLQRRRKLGKLRGALDMLSGTHRAVLRAEKAMFHHPALRCVVCNSEMVRGEITRHYQVDPAKLVVIRNGVDLQRFHPASGAERSAARVALGCPDGKTVFLFVGSGFERKGVDLALQALARDAAQHQAMLVVVGRDKHQGRYQALTQSLGIAASVQFVGPQDNVLPYYHAADALVLPTLYDPQSNAVLEAMACGLPVITSIGCGAAELLGDGAGYVVDALDLPGLASAMSALMNRPHASAVGARARLAIEPYSLERMSTDYLALYARLLAGAEPSDP